MILFSVSLIPAHHSCNSCGQGIWKLINLRFHCKECPDFDQCEECFKQERHPHQIQVFGLIKLDKEGDQYFHFHISGTKIKSYPIQSNLIHRVCGAAVEHMFQNREGQGSNPTECRALFLFLYFQYCVLKRVHPGKAAYLIFRISIVA